MHASGEFLDRSHRFLYLLPNFRGWRQAGIAQPINGQTMRFSSGLAIAPFSRSAMRRQKPFAFAHHRREVVRLENSIRLRSMDNPMDGNCV